VTDLGDPGAGEGFDEGLDLTPRTTAVADRPRARRPRPIGAYLALGAVALGIGFVVLQGLGDATLYFRNVDEAVAERDELGTRRFRLQGLVRDDIDVRGPGDATFTLTFNGADVPVHLTGDRPPLFGDGEPVVLEGRFDDAGAVFLADRALVKHSEEYEAEHEDRVVDAEDGEAGLPAP